MRRKIGPPSSRLPHLYWSQSPLPIHPRQFDPRFRRPKPRFFLGAVLWHGRIGRSIRRDARAHRNHPTPSQIPCPSQTRSQSEPKRASRRAAPSHLSHALNDINLSCAHVVYAAAASQIRFTVDRAEESSVFRAFHSSAKGLRPAAGEFKHAREIAVPTMTHSIPQTTAPLPTPRDPFSHFWGTQGQWGACM